MNEMEEILTFSPLLCSGVYFGHPPRPFSSTLQWHWRGFEKRDPRKIALVRSQPFASHRPGWPRIWGYNGPIFGAKTSLAIFSNIWIASVVLMPRRNSIRAISLPVLVPPMRSKHSFGWSFGSLPSLTFLIIASKMIKLVIPLTPPPSKLSNLTGFCGLHCLPLSYRSLLWWMMDENYPACCVLAGCCQWLWHSPDFSSLKKGL